MSTRCTRCHTTSHHPMDAFFKWCARCKRSYGEVEIHDHERALLGEIHRNNPTLTLVEVVDAARLQKRIYGPTS